MVLWCSGTSPRAGFFNAHPLGRVAVIASFDPEPIASFTKIAGYYIENYDNYEFTGYVCYFDTAPRRN